MAHLHVRIYGIWNGRATKEREFSGFSKKRPYFYAFCFLQMESTLFCHPFFHRSLLAHFAIILLHMTFGSRPLRRHECDVS